MIGVSDHVCFFLCIIYENNPKRKFIYTMIYVNPLRSVGDSPAFSTKIFKNPGLTITPTGLVILTHFRITSRWELALDKVVIKTYSFTEECVGVCCQLKDSDDKSKLSKHMLDYLMDYFYDLSHCSSGLTPLLANPGNRALKS